MKVSDAGAVDSIKEYADRLRLAGDAGVGVIHVRTSELLRTIETTRRTIVLDGGEYIEWDVVSGSKAITVDNISKAIIEGDGNGDITEAMLAPFNKAKEFHSDQSSDDRYVFYVFINPHYWLDSNPYLNHLLHHYATLLPSTTIRVVLITPDAPLPDPLNEIVNTIRFKPPGHHELKRYLNNALEAFEDSKYNLSDDDKDKICYVGLGMSKEAFQRYVCMAIADGRGEANVNQVVAGVSVGKTEIVNKNDLLELYPTEDINDVGGMENLKEWVEERALCYSDEAREVGIEPPKGLVLVGVPGSGKSLIAKSIAKQLGIPLIRFDFGRVFNSLVGKSEERMRSALAMVESMAPVMLFCDEMDKGLGGIGGNGDSGTSQRVLGTFLTWLQENKAPVFTMATANNVDGLPPELLRRGRFDAIFSTGFPTQEERLQVLEIHLRKRGYNPSHYRKPDKMKVVEASKGYVPAEIEAAVKDALVKAFSAGVELSMDHVVNALAVMVPLSKAYNAKIQKMALWAAQNATPASRRYDTVDTTNVTSIDSGNRRRTRVRNNIEDDE